MSRSVEETRRDFLVRLARTALFVAPAVVSLDASPLAAQGGTTGGKGKATTTSTVGSLTPTSSGALQAPSQQQMQTDPSGSTLPWAPESGETAPWTVPPPTSTG
jgi:hypothetical protein